MPVTSIAFQDSATSTASTITGPATILAGDVLFLADRARNSTGVPTTVVPTGFTSIGNINDGFDSRQICSYKIATGAEASASITGMNGTAENRKALYVMRPNSAASVVTIASVGGQFTDSNPAAQNVTAGSGVAPLVVFGAYGTDSAAISPRTFSTTADGEITPSTNFYFAYKIYNSSPADSSIDMDDEGVANSLQSFYAQIADLISGAAGSSVGSASVTAAGAGVVSSALSATGSGAASGSAVQAAPAAAPAGGAGAATGRSAAITVSVSTAGGIGAAAGGSASTAAAAGFAHGNGNAATGTAPIEAIATETAIHSLVGGGGFAPGPRPAQPPVHARKDKSHPKVITVRIGDWPENPQIILGREQDAERESFYRRLGNLPAESVTKPVDEEEQALLEILAFAA